MAYEAISAGLNLLGAGFQFLGAKREAATRRAWQEYNNKLTYLSNAMNQNAITENEILAQQAAADQALINKRGSIQAEGATEVSAAAAGVAGNSVNQALVDVARTSAMVESRRQIQYNNALLAFDQQRKQSSFSAFMQQDRSVIPEPNIGTALLGALSKSAPALLDRYFGDDGGSDGSGNRPRGRIVNAVIPPWFSRTLGSL